MRLRDCRYLNPLCIESGITPRESGRFAEVTVVEISFQTDLPYGLAYFSEELHILKKGLASL